MKHTDIKAISEKQNYMEDTKANPVEALLIFPE